MTKLKGTLIRRCRQRLHERFQQCRIGRQIWRQLKQDRAQLPRLAHWLQALHQEPHRFLSFLEALEMRDGLVRFGGETKIRRRGIHPTGNSAGRRYATESSIQFDSIQLRGIELEESL